MEEQKLLFVYNAGSDLFSSATDMAHKIFSPSTYQCHLCALTFGKFSVKREWKSFIESLVIKSVFLHKNQFLKEFDLQFELSGVFLESAKGLKQIISRTEPESCTTLDELKKLVQQKTVMIRS